MVEAEEKAGHAIWRRRHRPVHADARTRSGPSSRARRASCRTSTSSGTAGDCSRWPRPRLPFRLDPADLSTLGTGELRRRHAVGSTAHPKIDPVTGEMVLFNYLLEPPVPDLVRGRGRRFASRADTGAGRGHGQAADDPRHGPDRALHRAVACPLIFDIAGLLTGGSVLDWRPDDGTRVALIPRDGGPVPVGDACEAFWVWHFANAFDLPDGRLSVDYVEWTYPVGSRRLRQPSLGSLIRGVVDPGSGRMTRDVVCDRDVEFPRVDDRELTRGHRTVATVGKLDRGQGRQDSLWFFDTARRHRDALGPGERVGGRADLHARHRTRVLGNDRHRPRRPVVLVLRAPRRATPRSGPIGKVRLPIRVPAGLHGAWLPAE